MNLQPASRRPPTQADVILLVAVLLTTAWVFWPTLGADFVSYDDPAYVTHHPMVNQGLRPAAVWWAVTAPHSSNWNPVTSLSHMLDVTLFGLNPAGHHGMNLALHLLNSALVFLLGRMMGGGPQVAALAAALFALHPLHVESVAWVSQRKDLLSTLFWLLALAAHLRQRRLWLWLCAALAMLAKPMAVTLPLTLLLLDWRPMRRLSALSWRRLLLEKTPLWLMSVLMTAVTVLAQRADGAMDFHRTLSWGDRLGTALIAPARYLARVFWPGEMSPFYPYRHDWPWWALTGAALLLAGVTTLAWRLRQRRPWLLGGWLWYGITLLPVSGLIQTGGHGMADRYTYVPLLGVFAMLAGEAGAWAVRCGPRARAVGHALAAVVLLACAWSSARQLKVWQTPRTLLEQMARVAGADHPAVIRETVLLRRIEGADEGETARLYEEGLQGNPDDLFLLLETSMSRARQGRFAGAYELIERARELAPEAPGWQFQLGEIQMLEGRFEEAVSTFQAALERHPRVGSGHGLIGRIRLRQGRPIEAVAAFEKAVAVDRWDWLSRNELGVALYQAGRLQEALRAIEQALWIHPGDPGIQQNLAAVRQALNKRDPDGL